MYLLVNVLLVSFLVENKYSTLFFKYDMYVSLVTFAVHVQWKKGEIENSVILSQKYFVNEILKLFWNPVTFLYQGLATDSS